MPAMKVFLYIIWCPTQGCLRMADSLSDLEHPDVTQTALMKQSHCTATRKYHIFYVVHLVPRYKEHRVSWSFVQNCTPSVYLSGAESTLVILK